MHTPASCMKRGERGEGRGRGEGEGEGGVGSAQVTVPSHLDTRTFNLS